VKSPSHETGPDDPGAEAQRLWTAFIAELGMQMHGIPIGVWSQKRWKQVSRENQDDFKACFSAWWLLKVERTPGGAVFSTYADDEDATEAGIAKYSKRLTRLLGEFFTLGKDEIPRFEVLRPELRPILGTAVDHRSQEQKPAPADGESRGSNGEIPAGDREAWEEVRRLAKEHLVRLAKTNSAVRLEWIEEAIEPAQLESVEDVNGRRAWTLRSPAPATTRVVLSLLEPSMPKVARGVAIVVLGDERRRPPD